MFNAKNLLNTLIEKYPNKLNYYKNIFVKSFEKLNDKILNTIKNFSPHIVIIGHVFNINEDVFLYCKENNIKICSWFIDSVSPEFLKDNTKNNFFSNYFMIIKFTNNCIIVL